MSAADVVPAPHLLLEFTTALAAATTQTAVLDAALPSAITALNAVSGALLLVDEAAQVLTVQAAQNLTAQTLWRDGSVTPQTPAGDAIADRRPLFFEHAGALSAAYPELDIDTGGIAAVATAVVPLLLADRALGVLILEFREPHEFTGAEQDFLTMLATHIALGLDRAALIDRLDSVGAQRRLRDRTAELEAERAFLATTLDSLGEAIIVCDAHGALVRFAGRAQEMHGQDAEPVPPEQWATRYHLYVPDLSRPLTLAEIPLYRAWHGETVRDVEIAICRPGHPPQHLLANGQPIVTSEGRPNGAVVAQRDVTSLHQHTRRLTELTTALQDEQAALQAEQAVSNAFVTFTEAAGRMHTVQELGALAMTTLQVILPGATALFYEPVGEKWRPLAWTPNIEPALLVTLQGGLPMNTPILTQMMATQQPVFLDGWTESEQGVEHTGSYHAVAAYPIVRGGTVTALLSLGLQTNVPWTDTQRRLISAIGRSFSLLYERISLAQQLAEQRDEAQRRSQALEAFAEMARDLAGETDRYMLIRRAQELMLSLLTPGYARYWERASDHWELKSQVGDIGDPELQRRLDEQGLPLDTPILHATWLTGRPHDHDQAAQGTDTPAGVVPHVHAATAFRVMARGQPVGLLEISLTEQHTWLPMDRALLDTALYSLELILDRSQGVAALEHSNAELRIANEELQAFAYSVSHDLRTPVRHVKGFTDLALKAFGQGQSDRAQRHLAIVATAADRMTEMIDAMLSLSRAGRTALVATPVVLQKVVQQAQRDALLEFPAQAVTWCLGPLPTVWADAVTLQQVMTNLLSNAMKFAAPDRPLLVRVWAEERPQEWAVFVQDTGSGFDERFTGKLFGVFQRLHTQDQFAGTGVGLATIKRIITRHGGHVWAEGQIGVGSTFGFTLPKGPE